jgi:hypothetical protein
VYQPVTPGAAGAGSPREAKRGRSAGKKKRADLLYICKTGEIGGQEEESRSSLYMQNGGDRRARRREQIFSIYIDEARSSSLPGKLHSHDGRRERESLWMKREHKQSLPRQSQTITDDSVDYKRLSLVRSSTKNITGSTN